jgi:hypothetical protein
MTAPSAVPRKRERRIKLDEVGPSDPSPLFVRSRSATEISSLARTDVRVRALNGLLDELVERVRGLARSDISPRIHELEPCLPDELVALDATAHGTLLKQCERRRLLVLRERTYDARGLDSDRRARASSPPGLSVQRRSNPGDLGVRCLPSEPRATDRAMMSSGGSDLARGDAGSDRARGRVAMARPGERKANDARTPGSTEPVASSSAPRGGLLLDHRGTLAGLLAGLLEIVDRVVRPDQRTPRRRRSAAASSTVGMPRGPAPAMNAAISDSRISHCLPTRTAPGMRLARQLSATQRSERPGKNEITGTRGPGRSPRAAFASSVRIPRYADPWRAVPSRPVDFGSVSSQRVGMRTLSGSTSRIF